MLIKMSLFGAISQNNKINKNRRVISLIKEFP